MGSVKIDIYRAERDYYNTSLSSEDDVYEILFALDAIKQDADNGNYEAMCVLLDFEKLFLKNNVCQEYYNIVNAISKGYKDKYGKDVTYALSIEDYEKTIIEVVAERLNLPKIECEKILKETISNIVSDNKQMWLEWCNKNYKNQFFNPKEKKKSHDLRWKDESSFYQADYNRKYVVSNMMLREYECPKDLQEMIDIQKNNNDKIKKLNQLKQNKKITKNQREQLRKRINLNIELCKDISILKQHYNIEINDTGAKGEAEIYSLSETDDNLVENICFENALDDWQIQQIKNIAKKVLTDKQLVIFNLYYISEMTQQEIANILGETRGHISRDLQISLEKIRKSL